MQATIVNGKITRNAANGLTKAAHTHNYRANQGSKMAKSHHRQLMGVEANHKHTNIGLTNLPKWQKHTKCR